MLLKAGKSKFFLQRKVAMLKLFLITDQNQYARGLICDLLVQYHQCQNDLAPWKLFMADLHCFNEEAGEISLSVLGRMTQANSQRRNIDGMASRYRLARPALKVSHYLDRKNSASVVPNRTRKYTVDRKGEEVTTTVTFFRKVIRQCMANIFQVVDPHVIKIKKSSDMAAKLLRGSAMPKKIWVPQGEVHVRFMKQVNFMQAKWFDKEYCEFAHRWFEDAPVAAARQRMIEGEDFETVLDEELRGESSDEEEEFDEEQASEVECDDALVVDDSLELSSEESESPAEDEGRADLPVSDEKYANEDPNDENVGPPSSHFLQAGWFQEIIR